MVLNPDDNHELDTEACVGEREGRVDRWGEGRRGGPQRGGWAIYIWGGGHTNASIRQIDSVYEFSKIQQNSAKFSKVQHGMLLHTMQ